MILMKPEGTEAEFDFHLANVVLLWRPLNFSRVFESCDLSLERGNFHGIVVQAQYQSSI